MKFVVQKQKNLDKSRLDFPINFFSFCSVEPTYDDRDAHFIAMNLFTEGDYILHRDFYVCAIFAPIASGGIKVVLAFLSIRWRIDIIISRTYAAISKQRKLIDIVFDSVVQVLSCNLVLRIVRDLQLEVGYRAELEYRN